MLDNDSEIKALRYLSDKFINLNILASQLSSNNEVENVSTALDIALSLVECSNEIKNLEDL